MRPLPLFNFLMWTFLAFALAACNPVLPPTAAPQDATESIASDELLPPSEPPLNLLRSEWRTDFERRTVEWDDIISGGPPKDGIPAIDTPTFEGVDEAAMWLSDRDPILVFEHNDEARGYPLAILIWHEIVNDQVGDLPVAITFCPLCNASIAFVSEFDGQALDFGTTGLLRNSDLIMYDRQSESWWQQATGEAIVGEHAGEQLEFLAVQILSFADFRTLFPDSQVLARPDVPRRYGANPYVGYDTHSGRPFLFDGDLDERLGATERVVGVQIGDTYVAYPFSTVSEAGAINDSIADVALVIFHKSGTASALDETTIAEGRDVGSTAVFERTVGDLTLTFEAIANGEYRDLETGSTWNFLGEAVAGDLMGERLNQRVAFDHFWFAWSAFFPETVIYQGE